MKVQVLVEIEGDDPDCDAIERALSGVTFIGGYKITSVTAIVRNSKGETHMDEYINQQVTIEIDDLGGEDRAMLSGRVQEPFLVHPDRRHLLETAVIIDHRVGVLRHRHVGAVPADPELRRRQSDRVAVDIDHLREANPGPFGQRRVRPNRVGHLRPRLHNTIIIGAPPPPLRPHQHRWSPRNRQITHRSTGSFDTPYIFG